MTPSPAPAVVRARAVAGVGALASALALAAVAPTVWGAQVAGAPSVREGEHDGASYVLSVPAKWNGGLVMFAHAYQGAGPGRGSVPASTLASHLGSNGYAWAASGFRSRGYRPDWFVEDTLALRERVIKELGRPRWTIIHGIAMGGHVAIASLELYPEAYQGAFIECGNIDGVGLADWLYAYTAAAEYFSGLPLLDTPRPAFDGLVAGTWLGLIGRPGDYTERGRRFDSVVKHLAGGDIPLRLEGMHEGYLWNLNPRDPGPQRTQEFARHADTRQIVYDIDPGLGLDAATLNREISRVTPAPGARSRETNPAFAELTGKIRGPVMALHETADFRVPFRLQQNYRRRAQAAGTGHLLVQRAVRWPGHCSFDGAVREQAFDDLVAWMERGVVPAGDDVLGDVTKLGLRWTPALHPADPARKP